MIPLFRYDIYLYVLNGDVNNGEITRLFTDDNMETSLIQQLQIVISLLSVLMVARTYIIRSQ